MIVYIHAEMRYANKTDCLLTGRKGVQPNECQAQRAQTAQPRMPACGHTDTVQERGWFPIKKRSKLRDRNLITKWRRP